MKSLAQWSVIIMAILAASGCSESDTSSETMAGESAAECGWATEGSLTVVDDLQNRLDAYAVTELSPDMSQLSESQLKVVDKLVAAARVMDEIFKIQSTPCRAEFLARAAELPEAQRADVERYMRINVGPWDRRFHFEPFFGEWEYPAGANYYPMDLSEADKTFISDPANGLDGLMTMVRRVDGELVAIPYSVFFAEELNRAATLLREAAALSENASMKAYLAARADAFLSDDYFESDMLWMDLDGAIEVTIGPYETYEDGVFGYKAAFEAFVTLTDPVESARLGKFKNELPWLEKNLPIPEADKNLTRGSESPIRVVDELFVAGDTRSGIQTIAYNLPNDEKVREAKGSKKVILRNIMESKFDQILLPLAQVLVAEDQLADLTSESFFLHTLWHEMSHGLGPGKITIDGRDTEVRLELKETYSTLEEAKADAMGEWAIFALTRAGRDYFPASIFRQQAATYLAGLFRSVRFGVGEAHGQANAIQFNYLVEKKAISFDAETERFSIDVEVFEGAVADLVTDLCRIQAAGDYAGSQQFIATYGGLSDDLAVGLKKLEDIPVDVDPVFSRFE
ncbi:MAG: hypothetical protein ACI9UK_000874 [Candidatus Krumholzibacteriia bacterium]|jgi:hypothetical protein